MERTDWITRGYSPSQARFLMATEITHHRFHSELWGEQGVQDLLDELLEIDRTAIKVVREYLENAVAAQAATLAA